MDEARFPMLRIAKDTMAMGGVAPAVFNAANELAVAAFLESRIPFLAIPRVVEQTVGAIKNFEPADLSDVIAVDAESRRVVSARIKHLTL